MKTALCGVALAAMFSGGCLMGSAKIRYQDQQGGVLVLQGDENKAMQDAQNKMAQHCGPGNWHIVKRETVKVGEEEYANKNTNYQEQTDRARDEDVVGGSSTDTDSASDTVHSSDGWGNSATSSDSATSTDSSYAQNTQEDESTVTQGGAQTQEVHGTRDVNEIRVHYTCGAVAAPGPAPAPAAAPAPAPAPAAQPGYPEEGAEQPAGDDQGDY